MKPPRDSAASPDPPLSGFAAFLGRHRYAVAAIDQVAISLFNFGLTFALVRLLSATEFGIVALWMAAANLAVGVHNALICMPLSIHVPGAPDETKKRRLEEALVSANLLVIILSVLAVICVNAVSDAEWAPNNFVVAAAIPLFIGTGLYREYYRSIAFGRHDMVLLAAVDAPYLAVTAACVAAMLLWPQHLAGLAAAFIAMTLGGALAQLCGAVRLRKHRVAVLRPGWIASYRAILGEVMWTLAGVVLTHVQARGYVYIITSLLGLAQLAALNAVGVLFRPVQTLLTAWRRSALPQLATQLTAGQIDIFDRKLVMALGAAVAGTAAWCALLWLGWQLIERYLLAGKYPDAGLLLMPWAIAVCLETIDFVLSTALQAAREFRFLAYVMLLSAPVTIIAAGGLTLWHGYNWTIYGLAIGDAVGVIMVSARLRRVRRRRAAASPAPSAAAAVQSLTG